MSKLALNNLLDITGSERIGWSPASIADCQLWWECDFSEKRGMSITTGPPDVYDSIPNLGRYGGTFSSAGALRPTVSYLESTNGTRRVATFDDTDDYQLSDLSAASWAQAHQEWTWVIAIRPTGQGRILGNHTGGGTTAGVDILWHATNEYIDVHVGNDTILVISSTTPVGSVPIAEVSIISITYSDAAGFNTRINGVSVASGALVGATTTASAASSLYLGATHPAASQMGGQIALVTGYSRVLTDTEIISVENYAAKYTGQSVLTTLAPTIYYNMVSPRNYSIDTGNAESGEQADVIHDLSGNAHDAIQATDSKQGTIVKVGIDGNPAVAVNGTSDSYGIGAGIGWPAGTSHSTLAVVSLDDATGSLDFLLNAITGNLIVCPLGNTAGQIGFYDGGAWRTGGAATTGDQVLEWHLNDATNLGEVFRNGVFVGSDTYGASTTLGGLTALFSNRVQTAGFLDGKSALTWHRDSLLTGTDLYTARSEIASCFPNVWTSDLLPLVVPGADALIDPSDDSTITTAGGSVATAADKSGRGNDVTQVTPANRPTHDQVNDCFDFVAASSQYLDWAVPNASEGTVWCWVKFGGINQAAFGSQDAAGDYCLIQCINTQKIRSYIGTTYTESIDTITLDAWHFIAVTWDGATLNQYIDDLTTVSRAAVGQTASTRALDIGCSDLNGVRGWYLNGSVGRVLLYHRALTAAEIAYLYGLGRVP